MQLRIDGVPHEVHLIPRMVYQAIVSKPGFSDAELPMFFNFLSKTNGIILVTTRPSRKR